MNVEVMDKDLRMWVLKMDAYFHPEKCRRCKRPLRVPLNEDMARRNWLFCETCKEFFRRTV